MCVCMCLCTVDQSIKTSFKTVKATDFKFDKHVSRDSPDMAPKNFPKRGVCKNSLGGDMHSHVCLLVFLFFY